MAFPMPRVADITHCAKTARAFDTFCFVLSASFLTIFAHPDLVEGCVVIMFQLLQHQLCVKQ
jgi:hypothetical protein